MQLSECERGVIEGLTQTFVFSRGRVLLSTIEYTRRRPNRRTVSCVKLVTL